MKQELVDEILGILLFAVAVILAAAMVSYVPEDLSWFASGPRTPVHNLVGAAGACIAGTLYFLLGASAWLLVLILFFWSWNVFTGRRMAFSPARNICLAVFLAVTGALFSLTGSAVAADRFQRGGLVGFVIANELSRYCSTVGAWIILLVLAALCLVVTAEVLFSPLLVQAFRGLLAWCRAGRENGWGLFAAVPAGKEAAENPAARVPKKRPVSGEKNTAAALLRPEAAAKPEAPPRETPPPAPVIRIVKPREDLPQEREDKPLVIGDYHLPPFDLLKDPPRLSEENVQEALVSGAKTLEQTLASFGVLVRVVDIERGPVITRYELEPAPGVRVNSINSLTDDIALAMQASSVRIQAPIPGKNRVGIEVPNGASAAVVLKDVLVQGDIRSSGSKITLALGKDTAGKPIIADLGDMPHLLVAGATGSGKSVCLNVIIMSILYNAAPNEVKFIMIDPKMVELNQYNDLPHMLCPAITDHKKVAAALGWVVAEMESRYKTLLKHQVKNIRAYHAKGFEMPFIVVIIDEFADLMQTSGKVIEGAVIRLAQLARAVGIHLILATQRPAVTVVTGTIKANLPSRVAFKVASQVDSRTILDEKGAEDLLGKGDMLFLRPGDPKPLRGQCSYLSDEEVHRVVDYIKSQQLPRYDEAVTARPVAAAGEGEAGERDEMFEEAVRVVMQTRQAAVALLQRKLGVGYGRAGRLIDSMERAGIVGPYNGSKAREILVDPDQWLLEHGGGVPAAARGDEESRKEGE